MPARILVVEDERIVADDIRRTLVRQGYDVPKPVASGADAIRLAAELKPQLVLIDIKLKGEMDGIEAAKTIRQRLHIPIVFLTSHSDEATLARAAEAQANGYLLKPFEDRELGTAVQFALHQDELECKLAEGQARLRRSEHLYRSLIKHLSGVSIVVFDDDLRVIMAEGYAANDTPPGTRLNDSLPSDRREARVAQLRAALVGVEAEYETAAEGLSQRVSVVPLLDDDGTVFAGMLVAHDITEHKRRAAQLEALSLTDELTGLRNRRGFIALAEQHARGAKRSRQPFVILFADLDGLKGINDTLGHEMGDQAIRDAAKVFEQTTREADIVGRLGGDEFAALLAGCTAEAVGIVISRIERGLARAGSGDLQSYRLSMSIGSASCDPSDPKSIDALLAEADQQMYSSKREKRAISSRPVASPALASGAR